MESGTTESPLLGVRNLGYTYGPAQVLYDVSFDVDPGELVILAGRNGAGKSTLLRCIAGWSKPSSGSIEISGTPIEQAERDARNLLMLVPDTPVFYDQLTAWEHLTFIARAYKLQDWESQASQLLRHYGLSSQRNAYPFTYSRGMQYKLGLSLALLVEPELLLLDEPFGPLDALSASQLWSDLQTYRDAGISVLVSSHQLPSEAKPDRYLLMDDGAILGDGSPNELAELFGVIGEPTLDRLLRGAVELEERTHVAH
ncbi:MAG: ABC transporter ATP-binding protein [Nitrolancea sp.]